VGLERGAGRIGEASDAYLATGYDKKQLTLSHAGRGAVTFRVEVDFTGTGAWREVVSLIVKPSEKREHRFPAAFGAYWLRLVSAQDTTATAKFTYE
jgi:hypothetical protein